MKRWSDNIYWVGKIKAGFVVYNTMRPKGSTDNEYRAHCSLPGVTIRKEYPNLEEAQRDVEVAINEWLQLAGLSDNK